MKFLIDTNIFIPLEPTRPADIEAGTTEVTKLARLVSEAGHQLYVHPAARADIQRDADEERRRLREILFEKYPSLPDPPVISAELEEILGRVEQETNDWVDHQLIAALTANAVDFLVTEDRDLYRKASRLDLSTRVLFIMEALSTVRDLFDKIPSPPPAIYAIKAHGLNDGDPIFRSLRSDYPGFDKWLNRCKREHRNAWIVRGDEPDYAGLCIIKQETSGEFGLAGKLLKLCTFTVSDRYNGFRFGELLLKTSFDYANSNRYDQIYVTVFDKHQRLISFLEEFGFETLEVRTPLGEAVLAKQLTFTERDKERLDPLDFNIRYGPYAVKIESAPCYVVPIKPEYHRLLFPEAERQLSLRAGEEPCGNSIRKAYLSHAGIRTIPIGASLLFYRSEDLQSVTSLAVVEDTMVSSSPTVIARFVGKRTVYRFDSIRDLCQREVLAILFRQARTLRNPISLDQLIGNECIKAAPQSIMEIRREAMRWLQNRLEE